MSEIKKIDQMKLEELFGMERGYVLDFSNNSMQKFIIDSVEIDIYEEKYSVFGDSKAKRLKAFIKLESDVIVKKLLCDMIDYKYDNDLKRNEYDDDYIINKPLIDKCKNIINSIGNSDDSDIIIKIESNVIEEDKKLLLHAIRKNIEEDKPILALDRLHTYCVGYARNLCTKYGINYDDKTPLHSLFGGYFKYIKNKNSIEAELTLNILRNATSIFDNYNYVRNNKSFAHDNEILNYHESLLIYRQVVAMLNFIESLEES